jgi:hypothetical protein
MSVPEMMETVMMCAPIYKEAISAPVSREISPSIKRISKHALFLIQTVHMEHMVVNPFVKEAAVDVCQDISCQGPKNIALISMSAPPAMEDVHTPV